jgi:hypothetical protein
MGARSAWTTADVIAAFVVGLLAMGLVGSLELALFTERTPAPPPATEYREPFP